MSVEPNGAMATCLSVERPSRVRWISKLMALPGAAILGLAPLGWLVDLPLSIWAPFTVVPALFAVLGAGPAFLAALAATASFGEGRVRLDRGVLHYGNHTRLPVDQIAMVWLRDPQRVEIRAVDGRVFVIMFAQPQHAHELAHAVQRGRRGTQAYALPVDDSRLRLMKDYVSWTLPAVLVSPAVAASPWLAVPALLTALAAGTLGVRNRRGLTLGADGVRIQTRWRRTSRFLRYADIEAVRQEQGVFGRRIVVRLRDGQTVKVPVTSSARATLFEALLKEGVQMHETGMQVGTSVAAIEAGEDMDEWRRRAEGAMTLGGDYRVAAIEPDKLEWLMRNPAASPTQRVGAALAMRGARGGRQQIRVAADVSTDPAVKEALELLASEDEVDAPSLEKALARVRHA